MKIFDWLLGKNRQKPPEEDFDWLLNRSLKKTDACDFGGTAMAAIWRAYN